MHAQDAPPALRQHFEIAPRLRRLDDAETVFVTRHVEIVGVVAGDLQKHAAVRPSFVGLSGRMEETRPKPDAGRHPLAVTDHYADILQRVAVSPVALDVGEKRAVVARTELS